ncbi:MAG: hypothetical protein ACOCV2_04845 [Persicimonas sp.]
MSSSTVKERRGQPTRGLILALLAAFFVGAPLAPLEAKSRDSDESRMQAREVEFPSEHSDDLDPPDDEVDWRYFKLDEQSNVEIELSFESDDVGGELKLVGATGDELDSVDVTDGEATLSESLDPGVYYVSVEADAKTPYKLSIGS